MSQPSRVWTIPSRRLEALPTISELVATQNLTVSTIAARDFQDESAHSTLIRSISEGELSLMVGADKSPIPYPVDRAHYFGENHIAYWLSGAADYLYLKKLIEVKETGAKHPVTFLDFACSSGRVLRHFLANEPLIDVVGVDIFSNYIQWMQRFLLGRGRYIQTTAVPYIPLPDDSVDLVYGGSIFSHLDEFEESWIAELGRVMKPGGIAFLTVLTDRVWSLLDPDNPVLRHIVDHPHTCLISGDEHVKIPFFKGELPEERVVFRSVDAPHFNVHVFLSAEHIRRRWNQYLQVREIVPGGHGPFQDAVILVK